MYSDKTSKRVGTINESSNMYFFSFLPFYGLGDRGSIPGRIIPKTQKMVLDNSLLNTQQYKIRIEGKVEQTRERSSALPYTSVYLFKREPSGRPRLWSPNLHIFCQIQLTFPHTHTYIYIYICVCVCVCAC